MKRGQRVVVRMNGHAERRGELSECDTNREAIYIRCDGGEGLLVCPKVVTIELEPLEQDPLLR